MRGIYQFYCIIDERRSYIGVSKNIEKRIKQHLSLLRKGKHHSNRWQQDFISIGEKFFKYRVLYESKSQNEDIRAKEKEFIAQYNPYYNTEYRGVVLASLTAKDLEKYKAIFKEERKKKVSIPVMIKQPQKEAESSKRWDELTIDEQIEFYKRDERQKEAAKRVKREAIVRKVKSMSNKEIEAMPNEWHHSILFNYVWNGGELKGWREKEEKERIERELRRNEKINEDSQRMFGCNFSELTIKQRTDYWDSIIKRSKIEGEKKTRETFALVALNCNEFDLYEKDVNGYISIKKKEMDRAMKKDMDNYTKEVNDYWNSYYQKRTKELY